MPLNTGSPTNGPSVGFGVRHYPAFGMGWCLSAWATRPWASSPGVNRSIEGWRFARRRPPPPHLAHPPAHKYCARWYSHLRLWHPLAVSDRLNMEDHKRAEPCYHLRRFRGSAALRRTRPVAATVPVQPLSTRTAAAAAAAWRSAGLGFAADAVAPPHPRRRPAGHADTADTADTADADNAG